MEPTDRILYYRLFARLLGMPPEKWDPEGMADILSGLQRPGCLERACGRLENALRSAGKMSLTEEYNRLFVGLGRGEVLPYSSWYLSGKLHSRSLVDLRADLHRLGIERQPGVKEPEDHAASLCESMALLLDTEEGAAFAQAAAFFQAHIEPWMDRFFSDLEAAPSARFFAAAAKAGRCFLEQEHKHWF